MTLLALKNISLRFGGPALLDGVNFAIERGERVCLLGRNGEGKSTLMRIVTGQQHADDGDVMRSPGLRIAEMPQDVPKGLSGTVREVIASGDRKSTRLNSSHSCAYRKPSYPLTNKTNKNTVTMIITQLH